MSPALCLPDARSCCVLFGSWNVGYTFDLLERVCRSPTPLDNCFPAYMGTLDTLVGVLFW